MRWRSRSVRSRAPTDVARSSAVCCLPTALSVHQSGASVKRCATILGLRCTPVQRRRYVLNGSNMRDSALARRARLNNLVQVQLDEASAGIVRSLLSGAPKQRRTEVKALVFEAPDRPVVADLEPPEIGPDEVLVRSRAVGICHSDFELLGGRYIIPVQLPDHPRARVVRRGGRGRRRRRRARGGRRGGRRVRRRAGGPRPLRLLDQRRRRRAVQGARRSGCTSCPRACLHSTGRARRAVLGRLQRDAVAPAASTPATRSPSSAAARSACWRPRRLVHQRARGARRAAGAPARAGARLGRPGALDPAADDFDDAVAELTQGRRSTW